MVGFRNWRTIMDHWGYTGRARRLLSTLGLLGLLLCAPGPALGAPAAGFPLQSSQASPVTGAVTISAPAVTPEPGLTGVQFKIDGYLLNALDATSPFQIIWSAASATGGEHTLTAEARYSSGAIIESAPLSVTVANPATFNRTLYVDASNGNDGFDGLGPSTAWRTLGKANSAVRPGDTVLLTGTFSGQTINPTVSGTADRPITFKRAPGQTAVLSGGSTTVSLSGRSYTIFDGLSIQNPSYEAFYLNSSHHIVIRNSSMTNIGTAYGSWGHAVELAQSSDNLIEGNTITNVGNRDSNSGDSIWLYTASDRNRFLNNTMKDGGHSLFQLSSQSGMSPSVDNILAKNTLSNTFTTPIIFSGGPNGADRTLIEYNKISDSGLGSTAGVYNPRPGIQFTGRNNIVRYNEIFNNAGPGIGFYAYQFNSNYPPVYHEAIGNQVYHNVFYGNNRVDWAQWLIGTIHISEKNGLKVRDNYIANNIFFRNRGGILGGAYYTIAIYDCGWGSDFNGNRIENNILLRQPGTVGETMTAFIRQCGGSNLFYTLSQLQNTYPSTKNNLEVDPLFVNEATKDFHLRPGSPAIDRGVVITGIPFNGDAPDLGAYETGAGAPPVQSPFLGAPFAVPGTMQAEDFDNGGEGLAYHDKNTDVPGNAGGLYRTSESVDIVGDGGSGYKVNNFETGEWMEYTINVGTAGTYRIDVQAASQFPASAYHVEIDGVNVTGSVVVPNTGGWNNFQDVGVGGISLSAGQHVLRIVSDQQYLDLTSIRISTDADTQAPAVPTGLAAMAVSPTQIDLAWTASTDNVGVTGYRVFRGGVQIAAPSTTSYSDTGLSPSTSYTYTVAAVDAAGNVSGPSSPASATTQAAPPDTTSPSVSITAPSASATVAGTISVSASASDDVGVVGVQFKLDGANLDAEDTTSPYSLSWNTTLVSNGAHTLTAVARDAAGNSSTSAGVSVTVDNAAPVISAVASSAVSSSSATITWTTNEASDSQVEYGPTTAYGQATALNATLVTSHSVGLSGLAASTLYHYRVKSKDAAGNLAASEDFTFTTLAPPATQSPFRGTPFSIPGAFEAEDFDVGGEGVAYHDNVLGNAGEAARTSEDVDVFAPIGNSSGLIVKNFETGEWLEYTINVAITGLYRIEARVASTFPNSAFHIEVDGVNVTGNVPVPNTGSWGTFTYVGKGGISLSAGSHVLRIRSDLQYFDLDVIRIETSDLVAAYSFDEASGLTVTDLSANNNQGTMTNGPVRVAGRTGSAVSFDGLNDYILVPHSSSLSLSPALTLSAWVRKSSLVGYDTIFAKGTSAGVFNYYLDTNNAELLFGFVNGGYREFQTTGATLQPNTWYHLAATFDDAANTVRLYINGVQRAVFTTTVSLLTNTQALYIGRSQAQSGEYWSGLLDDLRIYSRALSQAEIQHDMTRGVRATMSPVTGGAIPAN
jgi:chitodextrinase